MARSLTNSATLEAQGFEKFVILSATKLGKFESKVDTVFDRYLYKPLYAINQVDVCNVINYYLSRIPLDFNSEVFRNRLNALRDKAADLNELLTNYSSFSTITNQPRTQKLSNPSTSSEAKREKLKNLLDSLKEEDLSDLVNLPTGIKTLFPGLEKTSTTLQDITSYLGKYESLKDIPDKEIQNIVNKVETLQSILSAISSLSTVQDLVNISNAQQYIQKLQNIVNPSRLIPTVKKLLQVAQNINQAGQQVLKVISFARLVVKIITILIKVATVLLQFLKTLPIPATFVVVGITNTFSDIQASIKEQKKEITRILKQVDNLLMVVYDFISFLLGKINTLIEQLRILLVNLEACKQLKNLPIVVEVKTVLTSLEKTQAALTLYSNNFTLNNNTAPQLRIPGYTLTVIEEEVVDEGKYLKRRRAVAYNNNGNMVLQGDLTFSTNIRVLLEELRLKLYREANISQDTSITVEDSLLLNNLSTILDLSFEDVENITLPQEEEFNSTVEIQQELDEFIKGLKNGSKLKKKVRKKVSERISKLKTTLQSEGANSINSNASTGVLNTLNTLTRQSLPDSKLLSEEERAQLKQLIRRSLIDKTLLRQAEEAKKKLERDNILRAQLAGG